MARSFSNQVDGRVELPITPMLDMTFQLMAFFLLTFNPYSPSEGRVDFMLPAETKRGLEVPLTSELAEPGKVDDLPITVIVRTTHDGVNDGNISALVVQSSSGEKVVSDLAGLRSHLASQRPDEAGLGKVKIAAESALRYACVMEVIDVCTQTGFASVAFVTPPDR